MPPTAPAPRTTIDDNAWQARDPDLQVYENTQFVDLDLVDWANPGLTFSDCRFRATRFNVSVHTGAAFVNCTFHGCSFFDATFDGCKLVGSRFERCTFPLLKVVGGDWSFVGLSGADLTGASFTSVRLREADLTGAVLVDAAVRDCDLTNAWTVKTDLTGCDLRGSDLSTLRLDDPLDRPVLQRAVVTPDQAVGIAMALGLDVRD